MVVMARKWIIAETVQAMVDIIPRAKVVMVVVLKEAMIEEIFAL